jgi:heme/copper-type cytochrome/quinol oxidase subunit 3
VTEARLELPVRARGRNSVGWWGVMCLIATEASLFAYLLFSYGYMASQYGPAWSPDPHPSLKLALPNTAVLLASSLAVWWGERGAKAGRRGQQLAGLAVAMALGAVFVGVQMLEWKAKSYGPASGSYGSLYFIITGFHMAHVIAGLGVLAAIFGWSAAGYFDRRHHGPVLVASAYWHFVDAVWIAVFFTFYVSPYLG